MPYGRAEKHHWRFLSEAAEAEVLRVLNGLPGPIREKVGAIPVVCEPFPSDERVADGVDADLMGLFDGDAFDEEGQHPLPPQIYLFLENIWEDADHDLDEYRRQVRKTLLHEIGHYLGLEEDDLERRGME